MTKKIKICHITTVHPVFDVRIFKKECASAVRVGYDVTLIAQYPKNSNVEGVSIIALPIFKNRFIRIVAGTFIAFCKALRQGADIYQFHDVEFIHFAIILKLLTFKKIIYDVHENYHVQVLNKEWLGGPLSRIIVSFIIGIAEKFGVLLFDGVIAAWPEIGKQFISDKTIVIQNFPDIDIIKRSGVFSTQKLKPVIVYAGSLTKIRGIRELIQAVGILNGKAELWLLGNWWSSVFERQCMIEAGFRWTKYLGFKTLEETYSIMKASDVGVINFLPVLYHRYCVPTKPFEYMACGLPVIMSDIPFWRSLFGDCVLYVNPLDPEDIAEKLNMLLKNRMMRDELSAKAALMIEKSFLWDRESGKLIDFYDKILFGLK